MNHKGDLCAYLKTPDSHAQVCSIFNYLHATYPPESTMTAGEGLYSGLKYTLGANIARLNTLYAEVGAKLRMVKTQADVHFEPLGFTDSQIKVLAFYYKLCVVYSERPDDILYGKDGLWALEVDEPEDAKVPWPEVCSRLSSSPWIHDVAPFTVLSHLMCNVVKEMHHGHRGLATNILNELESEDSTHKLLTRMVLDAQIPIRVTFAHKIERAGDEADFYLPASLRDELLDGAVLSRIVKLSKFNALFRVACMPKRLYNLHPGDLFAYCIIEPSSKGPHDQPWETCIDLGVAHFIFGKQPNFNDLLRAGMAASNTA